MIEHKRALVGALFAWPDATPVAWVRLADLDDEVSVDDWLELSLPPILRALRRRGVQALAWMDCWGWAGPHLNAHGFRRLTEVITLVKWDRALPSVDAGGIRLRSVSNEDFPAVMAVEREAFAPHWWHSEALMRREAAASCHFVAAELAGEIVGYAEGTLRLPGAHLNRIAVHPAHRGRGIGTLLLRDALQSFWRCGAVRVTLNTQSDNTSSQRLYRRFGFEPTGEIMVAWERVLKPPEPTTGT